MKSLARLLSLCAVIGGHTTSECTDDTTLLQVQSDVKSIHKKMTQPDAEDDDDSWDELSEAHEMALNIQTVVDKLVGPVESSLDDGLVRLAIAIDGALTEVLDEETKVAVRRSLKPALDQFWSNISETLDEAVASALAVAHEASENDLVMHEIEEDEGVSELEVAGEHTSSRRRSGGSRSRSRGSRSRSSRPSPPPAGSRRRSWNRRRAPPPAPRRRRMPSPEEIAEWAEQAQADAQALVADMLGWR